MVRLTPDGVLKVHVVDTIANLAAPTEAELAAGTAVHDFLTRTGIDTPEEGTDADASDLGSDRDKSVPATIGGQLTAEFFRDDGTGGTTDDAWTAQPRKLVTNLVIARFGGSDTDYAIQATDTVEVWPVRISQRSNNRAVGGETLRFTCTYALRLDPELAAVVAA